VVGQLIEMRKQVKIVHFRTEDQQRIRFVRVLSKYNEDIGLRKAKRLLDEMLRGRPIIYDLNDFDLNKFISALEGMDIYFEVLNDSDILQ